jgi:hypothetical protein
MRKQKWLFVHGCDCTIGICTRRYSKGRVKAAQMRQRIGDGLNKQRQFTGMNESI